MDQLVRLTDIRNFVLILNQGPDPALTRSAQQHLLQMVAQNCLLEQDDRREQQQTGLDYKRRQNFSFGSQSST